MAFIYEKREVVLGFKKDKPTVYVIAPVKQQQVTFDKLLDEVSNSCGVGRAVVKASVEGLIDRMLLFMEYGMSVKLGDFGTFKPTFNVKSQQSKEDLGADNVKRKKIIFTPGKRFKSMLSEVPVNTFEESDQIVSNGNGGSSGGNDTGGGNDDGGGDDGGFVDPAA